MLNLYVYQKSRENYTWPMAKSVPKGRGRKTGVQEHVYWFWNCTNTRLYFADKINLGQRVNKDSTHILSSLILFALCGFVCVD